MQIVIFFELLFQLFIVQPEEKSSTSHLIHNLYRGPDSYYWYVAIHTFIDRLLTSYQGKNWLKLSLLFVSINLLFTLRKHYSCIGTSTCRPSWFKCKRLYIESLFARLISFFNPYPLNSTDTLRSVSIIVTPPTYMYSRAVADFHHDHSEEDRSSCTNFHCKYAYLSIPQSFRLKLGVSGCLGVYLSA